MKAEEVKNPNDGWHPNISTLPPVVQNQLARTFTDAQREMAPLVIECAIMRLVRTGEAKKYEQEFHLVEGAGLTIKKRITYYKVYPQ